MPPRFRFAKPERLKKSTSAPQASINQNRTQGPTRASAAGITGAPCGRASLPPAHAPRARKDEDGGAPMSRAPARRCWCGGALADARQRTAQRT